MKIVTPDFVILSEMREAFSYCPETGDITWRRANGAWGKNARSTGDVAGATRKGRAYKIIGFMGKEYLAHRLAWFLHTGDWPSQVIDHINRNPSDNRFSNLRECTQAQNTCNHKIKSNCTSGKTGVYWHKGTGKWRAEIQCNGQRQHLGLFETIEAASAAYKSAAITLHGEFAHV